jgi:hypothetical protein
MSDRDLFKRLAASWNACSNIPTSDLEQGKVVVTTPDAIRVTVARALLGARIGVGDGARRDTMTPEQVAEKAIYALSRIQQTPKEGGESD